ncbi:MAG: type I phosphomannose isomerase catalytic subunit [Phycisphaerales bacterium]
MSIQPTPYPLTFEPLLFEKVWGGRRLADIGKRLPSPTALYGECWELADMAATSLSGAGGKPARSVVANGAFKGRSLTEVIAVWGTDLLGTAPLTAAGGFPILIKFLDATENLSVQAHPSAEFAARSPGAHLKTESWYIMDVEPGAVIYKGIKQGVTKEHFEAHVEDGTLVNDLIEIAAVPGTCHTLPSGTCHALGSGVLVAEVQTASDTTFRVFDWGRTGRELHVREALECIPFSPAPRGTRLLPDQSCARIATTDFYTIDEFRSFEYDELAIATGTGCTVLLILEGGGRLDSSGGAFEPLDVSMGMTVLVPAAVCGRAMLKAGPGMRVLRVGVQ